MRLTVLSYGVAGLLLPFLILAEVRQAAAHALGADCKLQGNRVEVEAYYDDDTAAAFATVTVQDQGEQTVAQGRTDARGRWQFPAPAPGRYRVLVNAGEGHQARITIIIPAPAAPSVSTGGAAEVERDSSEKGETPEPTVVVTEGPPRGQFTRTPWLPAATGLGIIGFLTLGWWVGRKRFGGRTA